jgi:hypothetical protein
VSLEKITEITGSDMIEELSPRKEQDTTWMLYSLNGVWRWLNLHLVS